MVRLDGSIVSPTLMFSAKLWTADILSLMSFQHSSDMRIHISCWLVSRYKFVVFTEPTLLRALNTTAWTRMRHHLSCHGTLLFARFQRDSMGCLWNRVSQAHRPLQMLVIRN